MFVTFPKLYRAPVDDFGGGLGAAPSMDFVQVSDGQVELPKSFDPAAATFSREGPDLLVTDVEGNQVLVADYFMQETPPNLISAKGAVVDGALVERLSGSPTPSQVAGEVPPPAEAIGRVVSLDGEVTVIRADGSRVTLSNGDAVLQGDILETGDPGGIGVTLADGTVLSMGSDARLVLDEMVYDPATQDGSISVSVMKGIFTFVSGEVSKTSPDAMSINTPVGTIGIRGTQVGLDLSNGRDLTMVLMEEADGFVGEVVFTNGGGSITINQAYQAVTVSSYDMEPFAAPEFPVDVIAKMFGSALAHLPTEGSNANTYGVVPQADAAGADLNDFETAAGSPVEEEVDTSEQGLAQFEDVKDLGMPSMEDGEGLAGMEIPDAEELGIEVSELSGEAETAEGLADFDAALSEDGIEDLVTDAGTPLSADDLTAQANVIFGEDVEPMDTVEPVEVQRNDSISISEDEDVQPASILGDVLVGEPITTPVDEEGDQTEPEPQPEPVNTAPVADPGSVMMAEDNVFSGQLTATDLEGGALTFALADEGGPAHGMVQVSADGTFMYTPDPDFGGADSFTYMVEDDAGGMAMATVNVNITPVADRPQLAVANANGLEDNAVALTINAVMPAGTTETVESVILRGLVSGAVLSAGTDNGDGTWTLAPDELSGLRVTPPTDYSGTMKIEVEAVSSDGGRSGSAFSLNVSPVGDTPRIAVNDVVGNEDGAVSLSIDAAMPGGTGEAIDEIILSGVPIDAELSAGLDNGDGTWTLTPDQLSGLTLTPASDFNGTLALGISATSTDGSVATDTFNVLVHPVADTPVVAAADVTGSEDSAIALTLGTSMPAGTSETVNAITITNVPDGAFLSAGTDNGDGTWGLSPDDLIGLTLTPPTDYFGVLNIGVQATSTDGGVAMGGFNVTVEPLADQPQLAVADALGSEDGVIALTLAASMAAGTTEALYTITVEGVPQGALLNAGIDNGDGSWTLTPDLLNGLTLTPPHDYNGTFDLKVTAVSTDGGVATGNLGVTVLPVADAPVVAVADAVGAEDMAIDLAVAVTMPQGTTETLERIIVTGVPEGAQLSAGLDNGNTTWTLTPDELVGLSLIPPQDFNGVFELGFSAISTDGSVTSDAMAVHVGAVPDTPIVALSDVSGHEDGGVALVIAASMPSGTQETISSIQISGVPENASLSAGTDNGDGTWDVAPEDLSNLVLMPPEHFGGTLALGVTVTSSDGGVTSSQCNVAVVPVADVPILQVSDVVITVEAPPGDAIEGSSRADKLFGTMGADVIEGESGADIIYGDSEELTPPYEPPQGDDDDDDDRGRGRGDDDDDDYGHGQAGDDIPNAADSEPSVVTEPLVVPLAIETALVDVDGSEALSVGIAGVPTGATLSAGTDNGDGTWTLLGSDLSDLDNLTMTLAEGTPMEPFDLNITAFSSEFDTGEQAVNTASINVSFDAPVGGDDYIDAGEGSDTVYGGGGNDTIIGAEGADELHGESGDDVIDGGIGADTIDGGLGDDVLIGGGGADEFVFHAGDGNDIIMDLGHQDVLRFEGQEFNMDDFILKSDDTGQGGTTITFGEDAGVAVTLNDVTAEPGSGYSITQDGDAVVVTFDKDSID